MIPIEDRKWFVVVMSAAVLAIYAFGVQMGVPWWLSSVVNEDSPSVAVERPADAAGPYMLDRVVDGDTIRVVIDGTSTIVRLIGVDTPETKKPRTPVQCYGEDASAHTTDVLGAAGQVWLEYDLSQGRQDRYGRQLAYVWVDQTLLNLELVQAGYAHEYTYDDPYKYRPDFKAAQTAAEHDQRGLWSPATCAGDTSSGEANGG